MGPFVKERIPTRMCVLSVHNDADCEYFMDCEQAFSLSYLKSFRSEKTRVLSHLKPAESL